MNRKGEFGKATEFQALDWLFDPAQREYGSFFHSSINPHFTNTRYITTKGLQPTQHGSGRSL